MNNRKSTNGFVKHCLVLGLIGLLWSNAASAQIVGRYAHPVFDEVNTITEIPFSSAIRVGETDPTTLYLDFYEPSGDTLSARPLVITVFGGAFVAGSRDFVDMVAYCTRLAQHGYVTASIDYRLLSLWHLSASNIIRDGYMAAQDVSSAVRFFKANCEEYRIDTSRIFLLGNSAGSIAIFAEMFMGEEERPEETFEDPDLGPLHSSGYPEYASFSPKVAGAILHWGGVPDLDIIDSEEYRPLCMIHGTEDTTVPYDSGYCYSSYGSFMMPYMYGSHTIAAHLDDLGINDYEFHPFEGEEHAFYLNDFYQLIDEKFDTCFNIVRDFLLQHLNFPTSTLELPLQEIAIYPNPASQTITIDGMAMLQDQPCRIRITNVYGQEIVSTTFTITHPSFDISNWASGLYLVQFEWDEGRLCKKFIKR